jgi:hypothetical protein
MSMLSSRTQAGNSSSTRDRRRAHGEHCGHAHRVVLQQQADDPSTAGEDARAGGDTGPQRLVGDQRAGDSRRGEQHRHEQQAAAQEDRGEEAVRVLPDPVPHHADEPQEGDAGERHQTQRHDHPATVDAWMTESPRRTAITG